MATFWRHRDIGVDPDLACPVHFFANSAGPARHADIYLHRLIPALDARNRHAAVGRGGQSTNVGGWVGSRIEAGISESVEQIGCITAVAPTRVAVRPVFVLRPEIQIVEPLVGVRKLSRAVSGIAVEPVGTDQIQELA